MHLNRRTFLLGAAAAGVAAPWVARAAEPEFRLKFGNIVSGDHPLNTSMAKAGERIKNETDGRVTIELFPQTGVLMSTLVPVASINGIGFAYPTYDKVWESLDGPLGGHVRKAFSGAGIVCLEKSWNHGFREVTSSTKPILTPDDLNGFKIRVPPSPLWTSMFKAFGAAPVSIPWAETYSAMQTRIADGLEQPLVGLLVDKMYEVQKHCSLTNHMWDGFWILSNKRVWNGIPANLRE